MTPAGATATQVGLTGFSSLVFDSALAGIDVFPDAVLSIHSDEHGADGTALAVVARDNEQIALEVARKVAESIMSSPVHRSIRKRRMVPARSPLP